MKHGSGDEMWWKWTFNEAKQEENQMNDYDCHKWTIWVYQNFKFGELVFVKFEIYIYNIIHIYPEIF